MDNNEELYEIKHDVADPTGSGRRGTSVGMDLRNNALAHPQIRFRDRVSECDLYASEDELMIHMYCPRCENANQISSKKKRVTWSGERISIEVFQCTWPGCGLRMVVEDNLGREVS